ncbi:MAG: dihydrodipicolinate synthase family protein [Deltaproteobacteria bacterium]|nr:dihydrodipicolinate synthase family protein [Deltaproteobacteria bacterium]
MKRLLVTGASGLLGWNICHAPSGEWEIFGTYFTHPLSIPGVSLQKADLTDPGAVEALFEETRPEAVIHTAAVSDADHCQNHGAECSGINVDAAVHLANLCRRRSIPYLFTSSDLVFNGLAAPYREADPPSPVSIYGEQKVMAETGILAVYPEALVCRMPLMFGLPGPGSRSFLLPMLGAMRDGQALRLFVDEYRTPLSVSAAAEGLLLVLGRTGGLLHLGGPERISRFDFAMRVAEVFGANPACLVPCRQRDVVTSAPRPPDVSLDSSRAYAMGFSPPPLAEQIEKIRDRLNPLDSAGPLGYHGKPSRIGHRREKPMAKTISGIIPALTTPFEKGNLSLSGLKSNIKKYNAFDLSGYLVLGSTGESVLMNERESLTAVEAVRSAAAEGKTIMAGTGMPSTRETIQFTNMAAEAGADCAVVVTPFYYKAQMSARALEAYYREVAEHSKIPIVMYSVPKFTGLDLPLDAILSLAEHPNIAGLKDSSGNVALVEEIVKAAPEGFALFQGMGSVLFPSLVMGAKGGILALTDMAPSETVEIYQAVEAGDYRKARDVQIRVLTVNQRIVGGFGVPGIKCALDLLGYAGGEPRPPLMPVTAEARETIRKVLDQAGLM